MNEHGRKRDCLVVWRISDGRPGHDSQSDGLLQAIAALRDCNGHVLRGRPLPANILDMTLHRFPPGDSLPDPDFIIGAGHGTHMTMLAARWARGGIAVVLMKPSLPTSLFDYCLIPAHDSPPDRDNILVTQGALNTIQKTGRQDVNTGLILIGGESHHYGWDEEGLLSQILGAVNGMKNTRWEITDSPRTPPQTRLSLQHLDTPGISYIPYDAMEPGWLARRLPAIQSIWVTEDSISMIYEALTAGAAVGIFSVPVKRQGRITRAINDMASNKTITRYSDWEAGLVLTPVDPPLNEASRCAQVLLQKTGLI